MFFISKLIRTVKGKVIGLAITAAISAISHTPARAEVNLTDYGLKSVEADAFCVTQRITSAAGNRIANMYWSPAVFVERRCAPPRDGMEPGERTTSRNLFLAALSSCKNANITNDGDIWVRRVADAVSILIADGIRDPLSGASLLDRFNRESEECSPRRKG